MPSWDDSSISLNGKYCIILAVCHSAGLLLCCTQNCGNASELTPVQEEFKALTAVLKDRTRKTAGAGSGRTGFRQDPE